MGYSHMVRRLVYFGALLVAMAPRVWALEIVLQDGVDGYRGTDDCGLYEPASVADVNYGIGRLHNAGINRWGEHLTALVRFDLTGLPIDMKVTAARLELQHSGDMYPYREITLQAAPLTAANAGWIEGENDGTRVPIAGTPCWNWLAYGETQWDGEAGLRNAGFDESLASTAALVSKAPRRVTFDVPTALVQGWLDDPATNGGWRFYPLGGELVKGDAASVVTSDADLTPEQRPKLVIEVEDDPAIAEALERQRFARIQHALTADVFEHVATVIRVGEPARAMGRAQDLEIQLAGFAAALGSWAAGAEAPGELAGMVGGLEAGLAEAKTMLAADIAASHNARRGLANDFALGTATSMEKVFRRDGAFMGPFTDTLKIALAGNEYECAQVVVVPIDQDLRDVTWSAKPFKGGGRGIELSVAPVGYVKNDTPALETGPSPSEWWPDPILSFLDSFDCPTDEVQPLWITAYAPPGTRAGTYQTRLTVSAKGAEPKSIKLRVRVYDFDVPKQQHLKTIWGMSEPNFAMHHDSYDEEMAWKYFDMFLQHRMAPADLYRTKPTGIEGEDGVYHLASVEAQKRLIEAGSAWWNVGYVLAPKHVKDTHPTYDDYLADCVRMFSEELERVREAGWPEGSYGIYFLDETRDFEALSKATKVMKDNFPDVPLMTTGYDRSYGVDTDSPVANALDIWVPLTPRYAEDWEKIQQGRELGKDAWWYICVGPRGKDVLNWFTQYPAIRARLLMGAATWKYQPDGFLYYRTAGWIYGDGPITDGPMTDWLPRYHPGLPDGDGQIICAGPDGPLTTIRLENIRDGIEDYEYLWLLDSLSPGRDQLAARVPEDLLTDLTHYSEDPSVLGAWRESIAEAIEALAKETDRP